MPRSRGGAGPARAPARPAAPAPARPAPAAQQQRPMSTAPAQQAPAPVAQSSGGSGLFGQMASTAAGVAVGSSIGHAIGGFFGGGSSAPAAAPAEQQQPTQYQQAGSVDNYNQAGSYNSSAANVNDPNNPCAFDIKQFSDCMYANRGDTQICSWYMDQMKACVRAHQTS